MVAKLTLKPTLQPEILSNSHVVYVSICCDKLSFNYHKVDLKVIRAKDMCVYHMGIAQYFGCKVNLKVIGAKDMGVYHMGIALYFGCKDD